MGDLHPVGKRAKISPIFLVCPPLLRSSSLLLLADGLSKCFFFFRPPPPHVPVFPFLLFFTGLFQRCSHFLILFWGGRGGCGWQRTCILDAPSLSHSVEHSLTPSPFGVAWFFVALGLHVLALLGSPILPGIGLLPLDQSYPTPLLFGLVSPQLSLCSVLSTAIATPTPLGR